MIKNIDVIFRKPYNYCNLRKIIYHQYLPMLIGIFDQIGAQSDRLRCEVCQNLIFKAHEYWLSEARCCNSSYRLRY